ncbi:MAG: serine/threonine-protein kinase [Gemmataceae bacterium]
MAGKTGPCPKCSRSVQAPAVGPKSGVRPSNQPTLHLSTSGEDTDPSLPKLAPPSEYPFLASPEAPDELGRLGNYAVLKVLGSGAMGVVFQAQDLHLKRLVALKVVKPSLAAYVDSHRRFLREAQLAASIDHENIVTIFQVGEDRGVLFLAMQLLQGETLERRLLRSEGRLPLAEVLRIGREIAEGLAAAHARDLIHRDIKPANIWLESGRDRVKIVDFGLARGGSEDGELTQAGSVIGTPSYMAPEQANAEEVDSRCDLFSLGAVLYQASTGKLPFEGKDTLSVLSALASKTPTPPNKIIPSLPRKFSNLVMKLLVKDRHQRLQKAQDVVKTIEAIEAGEEDEVAEEKPAQEVRPARVQQKVVSASSPAEVKPMPREKQATRSGVNKPGVKKPIPQASRRRKRRQSGWTAERLVLVAAIVLLAVGLVVFIIGIIHRSGKTQSAAPLASPAALAANPRRVSPDLVDSGQACAAGRPGLTPLPATV